MVRQDQVKNAFRAATVREEPLAGIARGSLDAGGRLAPFPPEHVMGDAAGREPGTDLDGLFCGIMPQAMIHRQGQEGPAGPVRPCLQQEAERQTVRSSGNPDRDSGPRLERPQAVHQAGELAGDVMGHPAFTSSSDGPVPGRPDA